MNPNAIYQELSEAGEHWANAHEAAELLRETQKILKAKLMKESDEKSISAKELEATSTSTYEEHVRSAVKATGNEARAKVRYECKKIQADIWRTQAATERVANKYGA